MEENDKEKVFMLEQQNMALAKQYFSTLEDNKQLVVENERHCTQISDLQKSCDSYQAVIQNLYTRVMGIIKNSLTQLGVPVPEEECSGVLTAFGNDLMDENVVTSLLSTSVPTHSLEQPKSDSSGFNDEKASALLLRLSQMESLLKGEKPSADIQLCMKGSFKNDILRSAIRSSYQRIQSLLGEISGLQEQIKQLRRDIASQKTSKVKKETPDETSAPPPAPAPVIPISKQIETMIEKKEENKDGNEELRLEITKLTMLVESRNEELAQAEKEVQKMEKEVRDYQNRYYDHVSNSSTNDREKEYEIEQLKGEVNELRHVNDMEKNKQLSLRDEIESVLKNVERQLRENEEQMKQERDQFHADIDRMKQNETQLIHEKEAYEQKLKRRKLFSELYQTLEEIVHKLYKVIKSNKENSSVTDSNSVITVLKEQLSQMSEAYKNYESVIHKTKKLIDFGDKKNEQLSKELLELQKTIEDQKLQLEQERREKEELMKKQKDLEEENELIRTNNKVYEENCNKYDQEMKLLKDEITTIISNEDTFEQRLKNEQKLNGELKAKIDSLYDELSACKVSLKRSRSVYEHRLMKTKSDDDREVVDLMQEEMTRYKNELLCSICKLKPKDCILSRCQHIFCRNCIEERINKRERKCPRCLLPFGVDDVKRVWIINDPQLLFVHTLIMDDFSSVRTQIKNKIAGMDDVIDLIIDTIAHSLKPHNPQFPIPTSFVVTGSVGSGKTFLVKEIMKSLSIPYQFVKCSSIVQTIIGESEQCLKSIFQFSYEDHPSILVFDDLEVLLPHSHSITTMVQCRLSSLFLDEINKINLSNRKCVVIGIVNQTQLSQLNPVICCPDTIQRIIAIPKLDKNRRVAILTNHLHSFLDDSFIQQLADETSSYSAADLNSFCSFCLHNQVHDSILSYLYQRNSSFARQFHAIKPLDGGFNSLIGMSTIKQQVQDSIILPLLNWDKYAKLNLQPPSGCLFYGPSGCGKTAVIQALAYELRNRVEFIEVTCTDLLSKYLGDSEKKLHSIFTLARQSTPSILVFDNIEVITNTRGHDSSEEKTMDRLLSCLLTEIDGLYGSKRERVFIIGVTNNIGMIDSSVLRSGRLEFHLSFSMPMPQERREIIAKMIEKVRIPSDAERTQIIELLMNKTSFKSVADVKGLVERIIVKYITEGIDELTKEYIIQHFWIVCSKLSRIMLTDNGYSLFFVTISNCQALLFTHNNGIKQLPRINYLVIMDAYHCYYHYASRLTAQSYKTIYTQSTLC